jgi:integrase
VKQRLTDTAVSKAKPGKKVRKLTDGGGLVLEISASGSKLWRYRYKLKDKDGVFKENVFAIGEYVNAPSGERVEEAKRRKDARMFTLAEARQERDKARALVKQSQHPAHARQVEALQRTSENANTFEGVALEWIEKRKAKWSAQYAAKLGSALKSHVFPDIGHLPIRAVTAAHLLAILERVAAQGTVRTALMLRQWCSAVFRYAVSTLRADADPAAALDGAIEPPKTVSHRPLPQPEIKPFMERLSAYGGRRETVIAIHLLLLTFVRTIELRGAEWSEIDLENSLWRIPAERMKMDRPHLVPLSTQAVGLLAELSTLTGGSRWLFPNAHKPAKYMGVSTINRALEAMGYKGQFSAHGFRSTASTVLNEQGFRADLIERQLAHGEKDKVRAAYNQALYLEERRQMMQAWADLIDALRAGNNVIGFRRVA